VAIRAVSLLGPVEAWSADGEPIPLGPLRQQAVFAVLALKANVTVSPALILDELWGENAPASARQTIHTYVARLRRAIDPEAARWSRRGVLGSTGGGYVLALPSNALDVTEFEQFVARAEAAEAVGDVVEARDLLVEALCRWRGPALFGLSGPFLDMQRQRLEERRQSVRLDRLALELRLGRSHETVPELFSLQTENPLRERVVELLMVALYRSGRQGDALRLYADTRRLLADEFGVEPGPAMQQLHLRILRADQALMGGEVDGAGTPSPTGVVGTAGRSTATGPSGDEASTSHAPSRAPSPPASRRGTVPAQLPADVAAFTGRHTELAQLDALITGEGRADGSGPELMAVVISAVCGTAGVGKTALALRWAHRARDRFPDGQLYVNLRGYDPEQPMSTADALARFLSALGVPGQDVPVDVDDRAARYRTETARRRMLILLDNAFSVEQIRPLLPGSGSSAVLVTSRDSLAGLIAVHGAHRISLDLLPADGARALLCQLVGSRVDAEPDAAATLANQCARLPLALRVAAELAASRPTTPLADLVAELADEQRRLHMLDAGGDPRAAIATVFSWSVQHLPDDASRTFRLLGLHPGPDLDAYAIAALADADLPQARRTLDLLSRAHLIYPTGPARYGMHDLLRSYAAQLTMAEDTETPRQAALSRLVDYYRAATAAAMDRLYPADSHRRPKILAAATPIPDLTHPDTALGWLDGERPTLSAVAAFAASHGWPRHAIELSAILFRYLDGGHFTDALTIHGHARDAARTIGDRTSEAHALTSLGAAHRMLGRYDLAAANLQQALALFEEAGDLGGQARVLGNLGNVNDRLGNVEPALDQLQRAIALYQRAGDPVGEGRNLSSLASLEERLGRDEAAANHHERALCLSRRLHHNAGEAWTLSRLGNVEGRLGRQELAVNRLTQAQVLYRQLGQRTGEARALDSLGSAYLNLGQPECAIEQHRKALALFQESGDRDGESWALNGLGEAAHSTDHPADAIAHHTGALAIAIETGARDQQARACDGIGHAHHTLGDLAQAREDYEQALTLYTELGLPEADQAYARLAALDRASSSFEDPPNGGRPHP
jgi:DNA-binding SARP family transcriptional activator/Flp pilus assembly protein TadD